MKNLHIGILGTRGIPNRYGGFEQFAEKLAAGLVQKGMSVTVYNSSRHPWKQWQWGEVRIVHRYEPPGWLGAAGQFLYDLACLLHARRAGFDVLLVLGYTSNSIWSFLYPPDAQVVLNMDGWEWKRSKYPHWVRRFLLFSEKVAVRHCSLAVADSPVIQEYLAQRYGIAAHYIPYGADTGGSDDADVLRSYGLEQKEYYLLIARMVPENNIATILEGLSGREQHRPVLIISDMNTAYGKSILARFGNNKNFRFTGAIFDTHILYNLRKHCRLYFHGHSVGGTNPSLLEAMAACAPVCAHDNPFNRVVLGEDACYFDSAGDIRMRIAGKFHEQVQHAMCMRNLDKIYQQYNWPRIIDQYAVLFNLSCQPVHERKIAYTG